MANQQNVKQDYDTDARHHQPTPEELAQARAQAAAQASAVGNKQPSLEELMGALQDEMKTLERAFAGWYQLNRALQSHLNQMPPGTRRVGLPILKFSATANGRDAIECAVDVRKLPAEFVGYVLAPLSHNQLGIFIESAARVGAFAKELYNAGIAAEPQMQPGTAEPGQQA